MAIIHPPLMKPANENSTHPPTQTHLVRRVRTRLLSRKKRCTSPAAFFLVRLEEMYAGLKVLDGSLFHTFSVLHTMTEATLLSPGSMSASYVTYLVDRVKDGAEDPTFVGQILRI